MFGSEILALEISGIFTLQDPRPASRNLALPPTCQMGTRYTEATMNMERPVALTHVAEFALTYL
jgi:hypothetical protein